MVWWGGNGDGVVSGQWGWCGGEQWGWCSVRAMGMVWWQGLHGSRSFQQMPVHISADLEAMEETGKGLGFCLPLRSIQF